MLERMLSPQVTSAMTRARGPVPSEVSVVGWEGDVVVVVVEEPDGVEIVPPAVEH